MCILATDFSVLIKVHFNVQVFFSCVLIHLLQKGILLDFENLTVYQIFFLF